MSPGPAAWVMTQHRLASLVGRVGGGGRASFQTPRSLQAVRAPPFMKGRPHVVGLRLHSAPSRDGRPSHCTSKGRLPGAVLTRGPRGIAAQLLSKLQMKPLCLGPGCVLSFSVLLLS